jgi:AcrR family transcriptional regulator
MVQNALAERSGLRRREILLAASEVFREKGFHAAGMRDIAAHLGIAVGKLYNWFRSKQDLLAFCQRDCLQLLLRMVRHVEAAPLDAAAKLWLVVIGHLRCLNEATPGSLAHLEVESLAEEDLGAIVRLRRRYERAIRGLVTAGEESGQFRDVDPRVAAWAILGAVNWSVKWWRPSGAMPLDQLSQSFADHLVLGLLQRPAAFQRPSLEHLPDLESTDGR